MNNNITFEQYRNMYYSPNEGFKEECYRGFNSFRKGIHNVVFTCVKSIQGPQFAMKIMRTAIKVLMYIPSLTPRLNGMKFLLKEIKDLTNFINGMQSIDGLLNFKFAWKVIVINVSGLVLFVISIITLAEKFLIDCSAIKDTLANIPIFGVLPFGGVLHLALFGLFGSLFLFSLDKRKQLEQTSRRINEVKISFWENPLDLNKIQIKQLNYHERVSRLNEKIVSIEKQLFDGQNVEKKLVSTSEERTLKIHKKSLEELTQIFNKKKIELTNLEKKKRQWEYLGTHLNKIDSIELQSYQKAKEKKWRTKLNKNDQEKTINFLTIVNNVISITKQIFVVAAVTSGIGLTILPLGMLGLGLISCGIKITNYFFKKSLNEIKTAPVKMKHHFQLN